jgi:hypothetical protein
MSVCFRIVRQFEEKGSKVTIIPVFICAACKQEIKDLKNATIRTPQSRLVDVGVDCDILILHKRCVDAYKMSYELPFEDIVEEVLDNLNAVYVQKTRHLDPARNALFPAAWSDAQRRAASKGQHL